MGRKEERWGKKEGGEEGMNDKVSKCSMKKNSARDSNINSPAIWYGLGGTYVTVDSCFECQTVAIAFCVS